jgi:tRNA 2-selenouridine synthase
VLDLEGLARHRGSVLGGEAERQQPGQKAFETALWAALRQLIPAGRCGPSPKAGASGGCMFRGALRALRNGACTRVQAPAGSSGCDHLLERYTDLIADPAAFCERIERLVPQHGHERVEAWKALVMAGAWRQLATELVEDHYDPAYRKGGEGLYRQLGAARALPLEALDALTLARAVETLSI